MIYSPLGIQAALGTGVHPGSQGATMQPGLIPGQVQQTVSVAGVGVMVLVGVLVLVGVRVLVGVKVGVSDGVWVIVGVLV
jgi:hypothetical protein